MKVVMKKFLFLIIVVLMLYIMRAEILTGYARLFTVNTASKGADAILVLSGRIETRPKYAARLFQEGYAPRLFLTQERDYTGEISEYVKARNFYARKQLEDRGVPVEIIPNNKGGATSTFDEAYDVVDFLREQPMQRLIIVTDAFHTRRALYAFEKVFKQEGMGHVKIEMAAAPNPVYDETNWYQTEKGIITYLLESIKMVFYFFNSANTTLVKPN
jgi:uncharacterized SAM-binding protein YcdF (DUF218 family)